MPRDCTDFPVTNWFSHDVQSPCDRVSNTVMPKKQQKKQRPGNARRASKRGQNRQRNAHPFDSFLDSKSSHRANYQLSKPLPFKPMEPIKDNLHGWGQRTFVSLPISQARSGLTQDPAVAGMFVQATGSPGGQFIDSGASLPLNPAFMGNQALSIAQYYGKFRMKRVCLTYIPDVSNNASGGFSLAYMDDVLANVPQSAAIGSGAYSGQLLQEEFSCASRVSTYCCLDVPFREKADLFDTDFDGEYDGANYRLTCQGKLTAVNLSQAVSDGANIYSIGRFVLHAVIDYFAPGLLRLLDVPEEEEEKRAEAQRDELSRAFKAVSGKTRLGKVTDEKINDQKTKEKLKEVEKETSAIKSDGDEEDV